MRKFFSITILLFIISSFFVFSEGEREIQLTAVGTGITVIICIFLIGVLAMGAIAGGAVFYLGIGAFTEWR